MAWCFSTRASVATVLTTYPCVSWCLRVNVLDIHNSDTIMSAMASQITGVTIVYSTVCSGTDQRNHQRSVSLTFVRGIQQWPLNSPHKWPVMHKIFTFDDVIMINQICWSLARLTDFIVKHDMGIHSTLLTLCVGNPLVISAIFQSGIVIWPLKYDTLKLKQICQGICVNHYYLIFNSFSIICVLNHIHT